MFFLNLSLGEFVALFTALSGVVTALYLLDRAKRKKVVSSLRFWVAAPRVEEQQQRKRIREPWSLLLQLASLVLLLLAIAQLEWGSRKNAGRAHAIVLDTSSWMAQRNRDRLLFDRVKQRAKQYVERLPMHDRTMLIRADGIAVPVTQFIENKKELFRVIDGLKPSYSALSLAPALTLAAHALRWVDAASGEVVFVGGSRVANWDDETAAVPGLRVLEVPDAAEDVGIRRVAVARDPQADNLWTATVAIRNYGKTVRTVHAGLQFAATRFAPRVMALQAGEERTAEYKFSTTGAGMLTASIDAQDGLDLDNRVQLELPQATRPRVVVYSNRPAAWQPLLESDSHLQAIYLPPGRYEPGVVNADVVILDGVSPAVTPRVPSLWIMPERGHSPVAIAGTASGIVVNRWGNDSVLGVGLYSKEIHLKEAEIFEKSESDTAVAFSERGPLVVARRAVGRGARLVAIGFDPLGDQLKYDVTTPLLFVNVLRWLEPDGAKISDVSADAVGSASVSLDVMKGKQPLRVVDERGFAVPFTVRSGALQFYVEKPTIVRVITPEMERVLSLTLPGIGEFRWKAPGGAPHTLPGELELGQTAVDLWKFLAVLGGLGLVAEWLFFGKTRPLRWRPAQALRHHASKREPEMVQR